MSSTSSSRTRIRRRSERARARREATKILARQKMEQRRAKLRARKEKLVMAAKARRQARRERLGAMREKRNLRLRSAKLLKQLKADVKKTVSLHRTATPYMLFVADKNLAVRAAFKQANPTATSPQVFVAVAKQLSLDYKQLSPQQKQVYDSKAHTLREQELQRRSSSAVQSLKVKRPVTAFLLFSASVRKNVKSPGRQSFETMSKEVAEKWRNLPAEQKQKFQQQQKVDFERYQKQKQLLTQRLNQQLENKLNTQKTA